MSALTRLSLLLASIIGIVLLSIVVQYQVRLRLLVGEPLTIGFSKGIAIECLKENYLKGRIERVDLHGIYVIDDDGQFTIANQAESIGGPYLCPDFGVKIEDVQQRRYFVPFKDVIAIKTNNIWAWSNPFPS